MIYRTFIGFDPKIQIGVVVLSNAGTLAGVNDIGRQLIDPRVPLLTQQSPLVAPPKDRIAIVIDPAICSRPARGTSFTRWSTRS